MDNAYNDDPDIPVFWFVCADILWKKGRLDEDIKQTALEYLESETDIARWAEESPSLGRKRKVVLEKLKLKLQSPQPEAKPIRVKKLYNVLGILVTSMHFRFWMSMQRKKDFMGLM